MKNGKMIDLLLEILNEKDGLFSDVTLNDSQDAIMVRFIDGDGYVLTIEHLENREELIRQWARENPVSLSMEFMMIYLIESEIIDRETGRGCMKEIAIRASELEEKYSGQWG